MFIDYDIRGLYPKEVNEKLASFLANKFYYFLKKNKISRSIFLGIDERNSSIKLASAFANSYLNLPQAKITYLGVTPSPVFYFLCIKNKQAGVIVTASHLPLKYNGFKFILPNGLIWTYRGNFKKITSKNKNIEIKYKKKYLDEVYESYLKNLKRFYKLNKKHFIDLNKNNKSPNYFLLNKLTNSESNIKIKSGADLKVYSDLDGDRLWIKFKKRIFSAEEVLYVILKIGNYKKVGIPINFHKKILEKFPEIEFVFLPTGHTNIKRAYLKYSLDFAMEPTFHFYFFRELKTEAPILALLKLLEFDEKIGLDKLFLENFIVKRFTIKRNLDIARIIKIFQDDKYKVKKFDGIYIYKKNKNFFAGVHIRKSKTEINTFRVFIESDNKNILKLIEKKIKK